MNQFSPSQSLVHHRLRLLAVAPAVALCAAPPAGAAQPGHKKTEVVSVAVFTVAPYVMSGPNGPTGVLIDFFDHEVAPRMGVRFKWERPVTTARLEQSLMNGRVMFTPILLPTVRRERARIRFADRSYLHFEPCIALLPEHPLNRIDSPADLADIKVGWVQAGALPSFMLDKRIKLDRVGSVEWTVANLEKLQLGRIGAAYFSNCDTPRYFTAHMGIELKVLSLPLKPLALYGAFSPRTPAALVERYQRAAEEALADDRFALYLQKALTPHSAQIAPQSAP